MQRQLIEYKNKSFFQYKSAINSTTHREFVSELIALFYFRIYYLLKYITLQNISLPFKHAFTRCFYKDGIVIFYDMVRFVSPTQEECRVCYYEKAAAVVNEGTPYWRQCANHSQDNRYKVQDQGEGKVDFNGSHHASMYITP